jgi:thiol-disulfide isomerase/thioredoxin
MKFIHKIFISELFFLTIIVISTILTNITNLTFNLFENFIDESYISRYFISVLIIFLSHLLLARYFFKKFSYKINLDLVLIVLFINYLLFYVLSIVLGNQSLNFVNFILILFNLIFVYLGYYSLIIKNNTRKIFFLLVTIVLLLYFIYFVLYPLKFQKDNFGTYSGILKNINTVEDYKVYDFNNQKVNFEEEIVIVDFWNNNCGICIEKFPEINKFNQNLKNKKNIKLISINVINSPNDMITARNIAKKHNLNIDVFYIFKEDAKIYDVEVFPTILVIKNKKVIYKGTIETLNFSKHFIF